MMPSMSHYNSRDDNLYYCSLCISRNAPNRMSMVCPRHGVTSVDSDLNTNAYCDIYYSKTHDLGSRTWRRDICKKNKAGKEPEQETEGTEKEGVRGKMTSHQALLSDLQAKMSAFKTVTEFSSWNYQLNSKENSIAPAVGGQCKDIANLQSRMQQLEIEVLWNSMDSPELSRMIFQCQTNPTTMSTHYFNPYSTPMYLPYMSHSPNPHFMPNPAVPPHTYPMPPPFLPPNVPPHMNYNCQYMPSPHHNYVHQPTH
jgi:hypothetical protein